jgi:5-formyltetrahydrofolate cyclo-ligase
MVIASILRHYCLQTAFCYHPIAARKQPFSRTMSTSFASPSPCPDPSVALKKILRKQVRSKLSQLSPETLQKESQMVWARLFELQEYIDARSIGVFLSMPTGEILTDALLVDATQRAKHIYVPQVGKHFEKADMELIRVDTKIDSSETPDYIFHKAWPKNKWGIPEPPADSLLQAASPGDLDVIIVPGLAFDHFGNRLGQGKGYYDRFIARMLGPDVKHPVVIAVGLQCQLLDEESTIPTNAYDQKMDIIILPRKTLAFNTK